MLLMVGRVWLNMGVESAVTEAKQLGGTLVCPFAFIVL